MRGFVTTPARRTVTALGGVLLGLCALGAMATDYHPITPNPSARTIELTGEDLDPDTLAAIAREGAKVQLSARARARSASAYGLLLEATTEGIPVYWFNRGSGAGRESEIFSGDAEAPATRALLEARQLSIFKSGAVNGVGPEVADEEIVRAMMAVRANTMSYEAASPALTDMLIALLNERITPVVRSRGTVGEGDLGPLMNVAAAMVGEGMVYYRGERMSAARALKAAKLAPLKPFAADDSALTSSNAYASGQAGLLVHDAEAMLRWADLSYALDLEAMNSSITPLSHVVQANRPFPWLNWHAKRLLTMTRGSDLYEDDPKRIIQDPESLRASSIRQASAWQAWARLAASVRLQLNSSDHNPAVRVGVSPSDSWELDTPQLRKFYVHGGPQSHGEHGYIVSNANWDPYPLVNDLEAFTIALANMDVVISQRISRFTSPFFTGLKAPNEHGWGRWGGGFATSSLMQEIQGLAMPVAPEGNAIVQNVEDLQSQSRLKVARARLAVADSVELLAEDLLTSSFWLEQRRLEKPTRRFGPAVTALWPRFDAEVLAAAEGDREHSLHDRASQFLNQHAPQAIYAQAEPPLPVSGP